MLWAVMGISLIVAGIVRAPLLGGGGTPAGTGATTLRQFTFYQADNNGPSAVDLAPDLANPQALIATGDEVLRLQ